MRPRHIRWLGFTGFSVFCFISVLQNMKRIDEDLLSRSREALRKAGIPADGLEFEGRDAVLTGNVSSPVLRNRADSIMTHLKGVRKVDNRLVVTPPPVPVDLTSQLKALLSDKAIPFLVNSSKISEGGFDVIDKAVELLQKYPDACIEIAGHTDMTGDEAYNQRLSQLRAEAVEQLLIEGGIAASRLRAVGYGSSRPIADNATREGSRRNRRVEFIVMEEH